MKAKRILIIDDERPLLETLEMFLTEKGYAVGCAMFAKEGLKQSTAFDPHVIILDIRLPDMNGLDVLQELIRNGRKNIIIITAFHDMDITIKAVKFGAFDYIPKPIDVEELDRVIEKALKSSSSARMAETVSFDPSLPYVDGKIIGKSKGMKEIFKTIGVLSENRVTVLIDGETGTGKELIARAIHHNSPCRMHPFQAINCSTIVGTLLESELFGHEKGAFTGASGLKRGKFELAGQGTIFLDEVEEIPLELQSKLLRFLQEKEFERLGGEKRIRSNARVITATNKDLSEMVEKGLFREDLYYRLKVAIVKVPPLRERKSDIPLLVEHILKKINHELSKSIRKVEGEALKRMIEYDWPGNVRELENILIHAAIHTHGEVVLAEPITPLLGQKFSNHRNPKDMPRGEENLKNIEKEYITRVLNHTHWHLGKTCEVLGVSRPTLRHKLKAYKISSDLKTT
ncbi:MAG: sigma-54-dependent Fis family transcriptional regulator [Deltaproteobacteria bacterium]|nr:sigma-54-dependent Fis family transcriptional regulator [Deltaproteobacteria bacterium]